MLVLTHPHRPNHGDVAQWKNLKRLEVDHQVDPVYQRPEHTELFLRNIYTILWCILTTTNVVTTTVALSFLWHDSCIINKK